MKAGRTLQDMAAELARQRDTKKDYVAPTTELKMVESGLQPGGSTVLTVNGHGAFGINPLGHEQIASRVGIPQKYYDRMLAEAPELLRDNVNTWFKKKPEVRMVRTLDGDVRAFLSDRYRPLDNFDLADVAFDVLIKNGVTVESTQLTDRRLYIKAVTARISAEVKKGDVVQAGIVISNSEVGCGSVKVEPMVFRLVCLNGMIANDHAMRKYHVGRAGAEGELASEYFKDETRRADDRAFWLKVRDVIEGSFRKDVFERMVNSMRAAADQVITGDVPKVIELTQERFGLTDDEKGGVLRHLIKGGDLSKWGLLNAITATAQDVQDYDRSTDLERLGGVVLELPKSDWEAIAQAA